MTASTNSPPLVGITGRRSSGSVFAGRDTRFIGVNVDNFFADYAVHVARAGALPIYLPYDAVGPAIIDRLDAVLVTGGQDIHPSRWGGDEYVDDCMAADPTNPLSYDPARDHHEIELIRAAIEHSVPVLGVCRGHQVLNVALGGTLIPDIESSPIEHYSKRAAPFAGDADHTITFTVGSVAESIFGSHIARNSWHHQAVDKPGDGLVITGRASDGVVEAIEMPDKPVLGVQWHPEWQPDNDPVFAWIVAAARDR